MILVDSSVLIDLLANRETPQTNCLAALTLAQQQIGIADLVVTEVLQGTRDETHLRMTLAMLQEYIPCTVVDATVAREAARNHQALRRLGRTPRKTIDTLIATRCILDNIPLLFADRDFLPFVEHLNLRSALTETGPT